MFKFMFKYNVQVQCSVFNSMFDVQSLCPVFSQQCSMFRVQGSMFMFMFTVHSSKICVPCSSFTFQCSFSLFNFVMMLRCRKSGAHLQGSNGTASEYNFTGTIVDIEAPQNGASKKKNYIKNILWQPVGEQACLK